MPSSTQSRTLALRLQIPWLPPLLAQSRPFGVFFPLCTATRPEKQRGKLEEQKGGEKRREEKKEGRGRRSSQAPRRRRPPVSTGKKLELPLHVSYRGMPWMPLSPGEFKDTTTISESIKEEEVLRRVVPRTHVVEQLPSHVVYQQPRS
jgi:hypothetical protein